MRKTKLWFAAIALVVGFPVYSENAEHKGDPYTLDVCPVSGDALDSMGDPVIEVKDGRELRFCCGACPPKFDKDSATYLSKIDSMMIADQKPHYPLKTDLITGNPLPVDDETVDIVHFNRLVRLGSDESVQAFLKSPDEFIKKLDEAVIAAQKDSYPTDKCIISGKGLKEMGEPVQKVYANRLVQFCCDNCPTQFEAAPAKYLATLAGGHASAIHGDHK